MGVLDGVQKVAVGARFNALLLPYEYSGRVESRTYIKINRREMMKPNLLRAILLATALFIPHAAFAKKVTYYDCRNPDGSMSYRIYACGAGQQQISRQNRLGELRPPKYVNSKPPAARAASTANAKRAFVAGKAAYKRAKYVRAAKWYAKSAKQGYAPAQYAMASMYEQGLGVKLDYPKAASLYLKAAEQGLAPAQFSMGNMYDTGQGVTQDYKQALFWHGNAAERGNAQSQNKLGLMYSQGKGVARNKVIAHMWFNIAGATGLYEGRKNREEAEKRLTPEQVSEAQHLAAQWVKMHK
ncbi:MAG: tetratricopeptide repeat protein [Gallionellaceae bacterium]